MEGLSTIPRRVDAGSDRRSSDPLSVGIQLETKKHKGSISVSPTMAKKNKTSNSASPKNTTNRNAGNSATPKQHQVQLRRRSDGRVWTFNDVTYYDYSEYVTAKRSHNAMILKGTGILEAAQKLKEHELAAKKSLLRLHTKKVLKEELLHLLRR